jgi:hypothetical protein
LADPRADGPHAAADDARRLLAEHVAKLEIAAQRFEENVALAAGPDRLIPAG